MASGRVIHLIARFAAQTAIAMSYIQHRAVWQIKCVGEAQKLLKYVCLSKLSCGGLEVRVDLPKTHDAHHEQRAPNYLMIGQDSDILIFFSLTLKLLSHMLYTKHHRRTILLVT